MAKAHLSDDAAGDGARISPCKVLVWMLCGCASWALIFAAVALLT